MAAKKARRFILKLILVVALLAVLLVVLLESGIVGRTLLRIAGSKMGIELEAERVSIGVGGTIRLRRFSAVLADENAPFFFAQNITVTMHSIPKLLTSFDPNITAIRLVGPILTLRSDDTGRLNIVPLLSAFDRSSDRTGPPVIPDFMIVNGSFNYERAGSESVHVSRIEFKSVRTGDGKIEFALALPGQNTLDGKVDPETLEHALSLRLADIAALPSLAKEEIPRKLAVRADWKGQMDSRPTWRINGNLNIRELMLNNMAATCTANLIIDSTTLSAAVEQFCLTLPECNTLPGGISIAGGTVVYDYAANVVAVKELNVALLDGNAVIHAQLNPGRWFESRGIAEFSNLRLDPLLSTAALENAQLSGSVNIEPATDSRAMEPLAVSLRLRVSGEAFEAAGLQEIVANACLGTTRLVTKNASVPVFGGKVVPWISLTRHEDEWFAHVISEFKDIELERVLKTFTDETDTVPGKLGGTVRCRTSGSLKTLSGSADVALTESDLMHTDIIGDIYSALNLTFGELDAKGRGNMVVSAQGDKIEIMSFEYFNRGVEVRGAGEITALTMGKLSPVSGFATGSMQPLRETRLPGTKELDRLISGLQVGLLTVKIEGTLGDTTSRVVPMPEVQNALRSLLWRQLRD